MQSAKIVPTNCQFCGREVFHLRPDGFIVVNCCQAGELLYERGDKAQAYKAQLIQAWQQVKSRQPEFMS